MTSFEISLITLLCLAAGFGLGLWLQHRLPGHHLSKESQDTIKLGAGMVTTMSALVLGLLVSSAKNSFDSVNNSIAQSGARVIQLDLLLSQYGPETRNVRDRLKAYVSARVEAVWGKPTGAVSGLKSVEKSNSILEFHASLRNLTPQTELQKSLLNQVFQVAGEMQQSRLLVLEEQQDSLPTVFLVLLVGWLGMLFLSFGLFSPRNPTVFAVMLLCAISVASAVFLILEMSHPLDGLIKVSPAPLLKALELIGH